MNITFRLPPYTVVRSVNGKTYFVCEEVFLGGAQCNLRVHGQQTEEGELSVRSLLISVPQSEVHSLFPEAKVGSMITAF